MAVNKVERLVFLAFLEFREKSLISIHVTCEINFGVWICIMGSLCQYPVLIMIALNQCTNSFYYFVCLTLDFTVYIDMPSYASWWGLIKLATLKICRTMLYASFMNNLINAYLCCESSLRSIRFYVGYRKFRHYNLIKFPLRVTNYAIADSLTRLWRQYNNLSDSIDSSLNESEYYYFS